MTLAVGGTLNNNKQTKKKVPQELEIEGIQFVITHLLMPNGVPRDRFFYPILTLLIVFTFRGSIFPSPCPF